jgi:hypothetical protein
LQQALTWASHAETLKLGNSCSLRKSDARACNRIGALATALSTMMRSSWLRLRPDERHLVLAGGSELMFQTSNMKPNDLAPCGSEVRLLPMVKAGDLRFQRGARRRLCFGSHPGR